MVCWARAEIICSIYVGISVRPGQLFTGAGAGAGADFWTSTGAGAGANFLDLAPAGAGAGVRYPTYLYALIGTRSRICTAFSAC